MQVANILPRDVTAPVVQPETLGGAAVRARNLGRNFDGHRVLANLDLDVWPGEFLSIVGKSGCGKSTLLRLIAGLDRPDSGSVTVDGLPAQAAGDRLRIMFQEPRLLPWASVAENVGVGLRRGADADAISKALQSVQLAEKADFWPAQLSGGQRQRAALARALVSHPGLLLLDEPLGALDALTRLTMQQLIRDMHDRAGFTAVLVTHDVAEAVALSDRIIVLGQGGIVKETSILRAGPIGRSRAELASIEAEIIDAIFTA